MRRTSRHKAGIRSDDSVIEAVAGQVDISRKDEVFVVVGGRIAHIDQVLSCGYSVWVFSHADSSRIAHATGEENHRQIGATGSPYRRQSTRCPRGRSPSLPADPIRH